MSRRTVQTCDRCGAEVTEGVVLEATRVPERTYTLLGDKLLDVDLCSDCHGGFRAWMQMVRERKDSL